MVNNKRSIVVIDDDIFLAESICQVLAREAEQVACYADPPELEVLAAHRPTIVILDCILGTMSGPDYMKQMRDMDSLRRVPVLLTTGYGELVESMHDLEDNYCEILPKPFDTQQLNAALDRLTLRAQ